MTSAAPVAIRSVATALPPHRLDQHEVLAHARTLLGQHDDAAWARFAPLFANVEVAHRNVCEPPEWFAGEPTFGERNARYRHWATVLSVEAAASALAAADVDPGDVGGLVFVSSTGLATPSLDVRLLAALRLPHRHLHHESMFGRGCAGGVVGLAQAADRARLLGPGRPVLLVVAELCSLTFRRRDDALANVVSAALFGDGVAAAVVVPDPDVAGPTVIGHDGMTWPGTEDLMGWDFDGDGLTVRLGRAIPELARREFADSVRSSCEHLGVDLDAVEHHLVHPGSGRVLDAVGAGLGLAPSALDLSRAVLRDHGNMSAATILFVLDRFMRMAPRPGSTAVLSALGPGFSAEHLVLRC